MGPDRWEAVVGAQRARSADQASVLIRRREVWTQAEQALATSTMLVERCLRAMAQSLTVRGQAAEAYADARTTLHAAADRRPVASAGPGGGSSLLGFEVEGLIDGQPVVATWTQGRLVCDPALLDRAELLIDLQEVFCDEAGRPRYVASLDGPDIAVALTLLRACDRVAVFSFSSPCAGQGDF